MAFNVEKRSNLSLPEQQSNRETPVDVHATDAQPAHENPTGLHRPIVRLNLAAIERDLNLLREGFQDINRQLDEPRAPLNAQIIENLMAGYQFIDRENSVGTDLLARGNSSHILELNTLVLFGTSTQAREEANDAIDYSREHFYGPPGEGIERLMEWLDMHSHFDAWNLAAGIYIFVVSQPQLFVEGNHRTGALLMSFLLLKEGLPPFVLRRDNALTHLQPSSLAKTNHKDSLRSILLLPRIRRRLARELASSSRREYLLD